MSASISASFNGATAMEPWKSFSCESVALALSRLQWGHGNGAVEEMGPDLWLLPDTGGFNAATAMEPWKSLM